MINGDLLRKNHLIKKSQRIDIWRFIEIKSYDIMNHIFPRVVVFSFAFILFFSSTSVFAEEFLEALPAGGIFLNPELSKNITLQKEKLKISKDKIEVEYTLINNSNRTLSGKMNFNLPPTPSTYDNPDADTSTWDETFYTLENEAIRKTPVTKDYPKNKKENDLYYLSLARQQAPYLDFIIFVDDQRIIPTLHMSAVLGNKDISEILIKNKIPLSAHFLGAGMPTLSQSEHVERNELKNKLALLKLVNKDLISEYNTPLWENRSTYFWTQSFPPNTPIKITLSYRPAAGFTCANFHPEGGGKMLEDLKYCLNQNIRTRENSTIVTYCPSPSFAKLLLSFFLGETKFENDILKFHEVNFITYSGINHQEQPINEFHLEIVPPKNGEMALCWSTPLEKVSDTYIAKHEKFIPPSVIEVLFIGD